MRIINYILIILFMSVAACSPKEKQYSLAEEISNLKTDQEKIDYLDQIYIDGQKVRDTKKSASLIQEFGMDSEELMEYVEAQWEQDSINLEKIETYLEIHGYPPIEFGLKVTNIPYIVVHHSKDYDSRERNFEWLYEAFMGGLIDNGAMSFYLGRMYELKHNKRFEMNSHSNYANDEIDSLIYHLGLQERKLALEAEISQ